MLQHRVLIEAATIAARVAALAETIAGDTRSTELTVIGLLTGSFVFAADLVRALAGHGVDTLVDFMSVSHYGTGVQSTGLVQIRKDIAIDVRGQHVLLIDDILDTGLTLDLVRGHLAARQPQSLRICVLLDKPDRRLVRIDADYVGFVIPDRWVVGYGLDLGGHGRGFSYVATVEPSADTTEETAP